MGRIITQVKVTNFLDREKTIEFSGLVDTGASHLVLPMAWKKEVKRFDLK